MDSPSAGHLVKHKRAEIRVDICVNCELAEDKRLKVFMEEIENLAPNMIDRYDEDTILDGFSSVELVPKQENRISTDLDEEAEKA